MIFSEIIKKSIAGNGHFFAFLNGIGECGTGDPFPTVRYGDIKFYKTTPVQFYQYNSLSESRTRFTSSRKALSRSVCL